MKSIALQLALAATVLIGCKKTEVAAEPLAAPTGCGSDKDCKGDRVCEQGQCVSPKAPTAPVETPDARPAVTPVEAKPNEAAPADASPGGSPPAGVAPAEPAAPSPALSRDDALRSPPSLGATRPSVLVAMFADLECPFSARATPVVRALLEKYGRPDGVVRFEYRHDPLDAHPHALMLARAGVAAHLQGRFWQFHDAVLADQRKVDEPSVLAMAKRIGLDEGNFGADRTWAPVGERVSRDRGIALALGVSGTPTFFVNGRKLVGIQTLDELEKVVLDEVEKAKATGKPPMEALLARIRENNPDYAKYLVDGDAPPPDARPPMPVDDTIWNVPVAAEDATLGPADALVTLVEFADFECPFSARLAPVLRGLAAKHSESLRIVFKHNPLAVHPAARSIALVSAFAQQKGTFWEFFDKTYAAPAPLSLESAVDIAVALGLDRAEVMASVGKNDGMARIEADQTLATRVDAVGTPNLYINGRRVVGARTMAELEALVTEAEVSAKALVAAGTPTSGVYAAIVGKGTQKTTLAGSVVDFTLAGAPHLGEPSAPATVVLFSDFQCPFSSRLVPILDRTQARFPGKIQLVFKHFPQAFHPEAVPAARMGICAEEQGKFWPLLRQFLDIDKQKDLTDHARREYARTAGLDMKALDACLASQRPDAVLERDAADATRGEVKGTPTLFINGHRFISPTGYNDRSLGAALGQLLGQRPE